MEGITKHLRFEATPLQGATMFKSIKKAINNQVNHKRHQERIHSTIITARKTKKSITQHTSRFTEETKQTWRDAMNEDI